jgi:hypothetical protein
MLKPSLLTSIAVAVSYHSLSLTFRLHLRFEVLWSVVVDCEVLSSDVV